MIYAGERVAPRMMGMAVSPWSPRLRLDCPPEVFSGETPASVSGEALAMSSQCLLLPPYLLSRKTSTSFPVFIVQTRNASGSLSLSWLTPQTTRKAWCGSGGSQQLKEAICGLRLCMSMSWHLWQRPGYLGARAAVLPPLHSILYTSIERFFFFI